MSLDITLLSRIQFAFTVAFHILFPAFSIGLISFIAVMEGIWLYTKNRLYLNICYFWTRIFALTFGMGVVSGVVMEFQLGTNWAGFTYAVGPVLGSLFTYEVMTAFFIEAGLLGVMIFGWKRVGPKFHFLSTLSVIFGVTLSAFWIMSANSWMQYPTGAVFRHGQFEIKNWVDVILNPLVGMRWLHMLLAAYLAASFVIAGVSAHYILQGKHQLFAKKCLSWVLMAILLMAPLQIYFGDAVGRNVHHYQPLKTAAMEGVWDTTAGAPFLLFAIPNQRQQKNQYAIGIPKLASFINTYRLEGKLIGLKTVSREDQPPVAIVFYAFRIMVLVGLLMFLLAIIGGVLYWRKRLFQARWFLRILPYVSPMGFVALIAGWVVSESGRQPWVVYHVLRTADSVSQITLQDVLISLGLIILVYGVIFGVYYFKFLAKMIKVGPPDHLIIENLPFAYLDETYTEGSK